MKMMRAVLLAVVLGSCTCTPDVQKAGKQSVVSKTATHKNVEPKTAETASAKKALTSVVPKPAAHASEPAKPKTAATAPAAKAAASGVSKPATHTNVAAKPKAAETASAKKAVATLLPKPASKQPTHTTVSAKPKAAVKAPAEKAAAMHVSKPVSHTNAAAKPKAAVTVPAEKAATKVAAEKSTPTVAPKTAPTSATKKAAEKSQPDLLPHATVTKKSPSELPVVRVVATDAVAQPVVHAHVQVAASAPAPSPASAPADADWRKEYKHAEDPSQLKWKWTTNKPGSYDISKKAPPKFLPIGEGAYQSAKAVAQRTTDKTKDCEDGKWNDCFLKAGNDLTDGHNYKHLEGKFGNAPARSAAGAAKLGLAIISMLFTILLC